jgi:alpha-D-ribose 1-methylphosphonate 5-triphosphate diphosphatase
MNDKLLFTNCRVVLADQVVEASVSVADGVIRAIDGPAERAEIVDFEGDYLLPGLVELHTDNLEKHLEPRPGVMWPSSLAAVLAHDGQIAAAGITTVFDAISLGDFDSKGNRGAMLEGSVQALREARTANILRAEHLLHLRCELADASVIDLFNRFADEPVLRLVSVMDHTPGQRQWADIDHFRQFHRNKGWSEAELQAEVLKRQRRMEEHSGRNRQMVIARSRAVGVPIASHDDTTAEHIAEAVADGIAIAEFPTSREAADLARRNGMKVIMGAPNLVRGGSHSGNISTEELSIAGLVDALSSDYVPISLLHAAIALHQRHGIDLTETVAMVSRTPAQMVGLDDRGEIAVGRRADLIRVRLAGEVPVVRAAWRQGQRIV